MGWYDEDDVRPHVECAGCGALLFAQTETADGDRAYHIDESWYCDDCIEDFKEEVFV